jgi:hypothetical protein
VPLPTNRVGENQPWQSYEDGRLVHTWEIVGSEMVNGHNCLKLIGTQHSDDWDRPRADRAAWKRQDTVWLLRTGIAYRVERTLDHRAAGGLQSTQSTERDAI